jgi:hypothetical protein
LPAHKPVDDAFEFILSAGIPFALPRLGPEVLWIMGRTANAKRHTMILLLVPKPRRGLVADPTMKWQPAIGEHPAIWCRRL